MLVLPVAALPLRETLFSTAGGKLVDKLELTATLKSVQSRQLKDISGMAYVDNGTFIAVHDMKYGEELAWSRVSLLQLPYQLSSGLQAANFKMNMIGWPARFINGETVQAPNDLESVAGIPGSFPGQPRKLALLCESTNSRKDTPVADLIYLAEVALAPPGGRVSIKDHTSWSSFTYSYNVEATAVAAVDGGYLFLWGERNETTIRWADLALEPKLTIGPVRGQASFNLTINMDWVNRPVVGLDVDEITGEIYLVSAYDLGSEQSNANEDADNGPYRSVTSTIGTVHANGTVNLFSSPQKVSYQDGFKVETVARAHTAPDESTFKTKFPATFIGTDDENYGGTLRKVQLLERDTYPDLFSTGVLLGIQAGIEIAAKAIAGCGSITGNGTGEEAERV